MLTFAVAQPVSSTAPDGSPSGRIAAMTLPMSSAFFSDLGKTIPDEFRAYLAIPAGETAVEPGKYPGMDQEFYDWLERAMSADYLPSIEFIRKNLKLFPATAARREDLAMLSYHIGDKQYLVAQTGGHSGRIYFFASRVQPGEVKSEAGAKSAFEAELKRLLRPELTKDIPTPAIEQLGGGYVGQIDPKGDKESKLTHSAFVITNSQIGLSLLKIMIPEGVMARLSRENEWFKDVGQVVEDSKVRGVTTRQREFEQKHNAH
jgi:hypothetical protein